MASIAAFDQSPLLELRTEAGAIYVCPSRMQRMRLQWTFRHFHVLPPQLLSRHDQRLIEKLTQSAVVRPRLPVASDTILGVVEKASPLLAAQSEDFAHHRVDLSDQAARWGALGGFAAGVAAIAFLLFWLHAISPKAPALAAVQAAGASQAREVSLPRASLLAAPPAAAPMATPVALVKAQATDPVTPPPVATTRHLASAQAVPAIAVETSDLPPAPAIEITSGERRLVTELPAQPFAHPFVAQQNLVGEVQLNALIAPDGSVEQITVVSGDPRLAAAGMRAVRQWHYSPYQTTGTAEEAKIKMNFFGSDAVSIASIAR